MIFWIVNPFDNLPGEGRRPLRYWLLCRALVAAGHEVVWWSSDFHHGEKQVRGLPAKFEVEGFRVRMIPTPPYARNVSPARWRSHATFARNWESSARTCVAGGTEAKPDCIVVSLPPLETASGALDLRKDWGCRVFVDIMDAWPETFYRLIPGPRCWKAWLGPRLLGSALRRACRAYREADGVSAVGQSYLALARRHGSRVPQHCCYHGIAVQAPEARNPDPEGYLRLVYVGHMGASYDLETLLKAVASLLDAGFKVRLDLAGSGPKADALAHWLETQAPQVRAHIRFHGYLGQHDLKALLAGGDFGIIPMLSESLVAVPYKAADYAEAGLGIVSCLEGELQTLLETHQAGVFYKAKDAGSLMGVLKSLCQDPSAWAGHGQRARMLAELLFDQASIYPRLVQFYEHIARGTAPVTPEPAH